MATRKRKSLDDISHVFQQFLYYRGQASTAGKTKENLAKKLRAFCRSNGVVLLGDDGQEINGNIVYKLDDPVYVGDKVYTGFELRKEGGDEFDDERALELAQEKGVVAEATVRELCLSEDTYQTIVAALRYANLEKALAEFEVNNTVVVNQDAFYRLYQQGKLTEAEIDSLFVAPEEPKYKLWPIAGKDEEEEDDA